MLYAKLPVAGRRPRGGRREAQDFPEPMALYAVFIRAGAILYGNFTGNTD